MRFEDEPYVRVFRRDTMGWQVMPWQGRAALLCILRKCDRAGIIELDGEGLEGLALVIGLPVDVTQAGVDALRGRGTVLFSDARLVVPKFIEAQECGTTDRLRKAEQRARARDQAKAAFALVTNRDEASQNGTARPESGQKVTAGHNESHGVTLSRAEPSRSELSRSDFPPSEESASALPRRKARGEKRNKSGPNPRHAPLTTRLAQVYVEVRGTKYLHQGEKDATALKRLLGASDDAEIEQRWRIALAWSGFPTCSTFHELASHWGKYQRPQSAAGPSLSERTVGRPADSVGRCAVCAGAGQVPAPPKVGVRLCYAHLAAWSESDVVRGAARPWELRDEFEEWLATNRTTEGAVTAVGP